MKLIPRKSSALFRLGRNLTLIGSVLLVLWCVWELSIRLEDFEANISSLISMSRAQNQSVIRNLYFYYRAPKSLGILLKITFLVMCLILSGLSFFLIRRRWSCAMLIIACIALGYAGICWEYYGIHLNNILVLIKWIPLLLLLTGAALCMTDLLREKKQQRPSDRVSLAGALAEKDGNEMRVLVSACLLGKNCRYDGGNNENEAVLRFLENKLIIPICPEVMGGMGTPRRPAELRWGRAVDADGRSVDEYYRKGALKCLALARREHATLAILKANSPSCSIRKIYDGSFSGKLVDGNGILGNMLIREGIPVLDETDFENYNTQKEGQ